MANWVHPNQKRGGSAAGLAVALVLGYGFLALAALIVWELVK